MREPTKVTIPFSTGWTGPKYLAVPSVGDARYEGMFFNFRLSDDNSRIKLEFACVQIRQLTYKKVRRPRNWFQPTLEWIETKRYLASADEFGTTSLMNEGNRLLTQRNIGVIVTDALNRGFSLDRSFVEKVLAPAENHLSIIIGSIEEQIFHRTLHQVA